MAGGILNSYGKFLVPAFTPVWLNVSFIVGALYFSDSFSQPAFVLAWSVFVGGVLQLLFQIPFLKQIGFLPKLDLKVNDPGVWRITRLMGPAILGVSVTQISLLINTVFASFLTVGSVSWLYYADRLMEFPVGVLGVALSTILLPSLSGSISSKNNQEYSSLVNWGLKLSILLAAPAALGLFILSIPLITTLFFYGAFTEYDVSMTQYALSAYSIGLVALILIKVLAPAFYAQKNIKTPVKIAIFTLFCTQVMNMIFIGFFGHTGLALAIALGACINAGLLFFYLIKDKVFVIEGGWIVFLIKIIFGLIVMACSLYYFKDSSDMWLNYSAWEKIYNLLFLIIVGMVSYFASLKIMGINLSDFTKKIS
jgi:putative peptidoglycan lipid II flippase